MLGYVGREGVEIRAQHVASRRLARRSRLSSRQRLQLHKRVASRHRRPVSLRRYCGATPEPPSPPLRRLRRPQRRRSSHPPLGSSVKNVPRPPPYPRIAASLRHVKPRRELPGRQPECRVKLFRRHRPGLIRPPRRIRLGLRRHSGSTTGGSGTRHASGPAWPPSARRRTARAAQAPRWQPVLQPEPPPRPPRVGDNSARQPRQ